LTNLLDGGVEKTEERKKLERIFLDQSGSQVTSFAESRAGNLLHTG
jgi:hypothetical protein